MREFKNEKARKFFLESLELDEIAQERAKREMEELGVLTDSTCDIKTEAAGLRVLADDLEDGVICEDEIEI